MKTMNEIISIELEGCRHDLYVSYPADMSTKLPTVLIFHAWAGRDDFCHHKANLMAQKGYVGIAIDLYGEGRRGETREECVALMSPLVQDRGMLRDRMRMLIDFIAQDRRVDRDKMIATGYCFGGLCVLDAVRNNLGLRAGISIHGLLGKPDYGLPDQYHSKVLALTGYRDPMVTAKDVAAFQEEMSSAGVDLQLMTFSTGLHAFTNPEAMDPDFGTVYDSVLDHRTTKYVEIFMEEIFHGR